MYYELLYRLVSENGFQNDSINGRMDNILTEIAVSQEKKIVALDDASMLSEMDLGDKSALPDAIINLVKMLKREINGNKN